MEALSSVEQISNNFPDHIFPFIYSFVGGRESLRQGIMDSFPHSTVIKTYATETFSSLRQRLNNTGLKPQSFQSSLTFWTTSSVSL